MYWETIFIRAMELISDRNEALFDAQSSGKFHYIHRYTSDRILIRHIILTCRWLNHISILCLGLDTAARNYTFKNLKVLEMEPLRFRKNELKVTTFFA